MCLLVLFFGAGLIAARRARLCRRVRPAALAALVSEEAAREPNFSSVFPDAVDVIVRGVKAGLPLLDCLKMITDRSARAGRSEFRSIVETQAVGMPLGEACVKLYERMPLPEANFFGIVVIIQQKAGGNLVRSARQPVARVARPQEDEGENPGDVDGGKGLGRRSSARCRSP